MPDRFAVKKYLQFQRRFLLLLIGTLCPFSRLISALPSMSVKQSLEVSGTLRDHLPGELLAEISGFPINGSLRISSNAQKVVVYLREGIAVYIASNAKKHRLFEILLQSETIKKDQLADIPDFTNDLVLRKTLADKNILSELECDHVFLQLQRTVLANCLTWTSGEWTLSPLQRIKEDLSFHLDSQRMLIDHARALSKSETSSRFRTLDETFEVTKRDFTKISLSPQEAFLLSRFEGKPLTAEDLKSISGMPIEDTLHALYTLWFGGILTRQHSNRAFRKEFLQEISSAKFELKKPVRKTPAATPADLNGGTSEVETADDAANEETPKVIKEITLDEYLKRIDEAATHYETLNIESTADLATLKKAYFDLAKRFHPDRYHAEADDILMPKIQHAFTEIAHAYETLKDPKLREVYDFRLRKAMEEFSSSTPKKTSHETHDDTATISAEDSFNRGFTHFMEDDYAKAVNHFASAARREPNVGRYHAYYGRALSFNPEEKHRAQVELRLAIKLDPKNTVFRMMLCEFLAEAGLQKMAMRELTSLLEISPSDAAARELLDSISKK